MKNLHPKSHRESVRTKINPLISLFLIVLTLFIAVFVQMEERRRGIELLRMEKIVRSRQEQYKDKQAALARMTSSQRVESLAAEMSGFKKLQSKQIVQFTGTSH